MKAIASAVLIAFLANGQLPPVEPVAQAPATTAAAAVPQLPATTAAAVAPVTPKVPVVPVVPQAPQPPSALPPIIPLDPGSFKCELNTCANRIINVIPGQGWSFECVGNCMGATINIDVGYDPLHPGMMVDYIDSIKFSKPGAGLGVTINIINTLAAWGHPVELNDFRCEAEGACFGVTINAYDGVRIHGANMDCSHDRSCVGCMVRDAWEMKACDMNQNPNGMMVYPWQVAHSGQTPPVGAWPTNSLPQLPVYTPASPQAATPNYAGYPKAPAAAVPQAPGTPQQPAYYYPQAPAQATNPNYNPYIV